VALGDDDTLERLNALAIAFLHLHVDHNRVARAEVRQLAGHLLGLELFNDLVHGTPPISPVFGARYGLKFVGPRNIHGEIHPATRETRHPARTAPAGRVAGARSAPATASGANGESPRGRPIAIPAALFPGRPPRDACNGDSPAGRLQTNPARPTVRRSTHRPASGPRHR